ncbi:MAG: hypothetical protein M3P27_02945 [Acidobacteriota bacterium]|nr:hypothetical protein [Acidobacteriota bacterium]
MKDVVLVPTFSRPEMLWHCLEHLFRCPEFTEHDVVVWLDWHADLPDPPLVEVEQVVGFFPGVHLVRLARHGRPGNSFNVLSAYRAAYESGADVVYLVEDDVMVRPDFFRFHRFVRSLLDVFCVVAAENTRRATPPQGNHFWATDDDYASLGVSFDRKALAEIVRHHSAEYFGDMHGYCQRNFGARFQKEEVEQDGLILRVMGEQRVLSAWPYEPRAQHVGWYGYHRQQGRPQGTLEQRYRQVQGRIY